MSSKSPINSRLKRAAERMKRGSQKSDVSTPIAEPAIVCAPTAPACLEVAGTTGRVFQKVISMGEPDDISLTSIIRATNLASEAFPSHRSTRLSTLPITESDLEDSFPSTDVLTARSLSEARLTDLTDRIQMTESGNASVSRRSTRRSTTSRYDVSPGFFWGCRSDVEIPERELAVTVTPGRDQCLGFLGRPLEEWGTSPLDQCRVYCSGAGEAP